MATPFPRLLTVAATACLTLALSTAVTSANANANNTTTKSTKSTKSTGASASRATSAPKTSFVTLRPWTTTGKLRVKATVRKAPANSGCVSSNVTERKGAYRCYIGNLVMDPAFKSPTSDRVAVRSGKRWVVYRGMSSFTPGPAGQARIVEVSLINGAVCTASSGAGPAALPKYPYWVGLCTGGPYGSTGATWRATVDDGQNTNYPLLALNSKRTKWAVPVESAPGVVTMVPVRTAYR